ncbi:MAG TPA: (deoxy)nucleoside triphosphate pyrophosphohydrolase [Bryobacteraceae bacterium]
MAAIIERGGRILICQRKLVQSHPLQWEFPGGKVEPGETPAQALARELEEELGIRGAAGPEITRYQFTYPGKKPISLIFFRIDQFAGEPENRIFHEMRWEEPRRLHEYDFVEGDTDFIRTLTYTGSYDHRDQDGRPGAE